MERGGLFNQSEWNYPRYNHISVILFFYLSFLIRVCSDGTAPNVAEADVEDCCQTFGTSSVADTTCTSHLGFVCEYDIYGTGHAASNPTPAGVVLRGSFIEFGLNSNGTIGITSVLE